MLRIVQLNLAYDGRLATPESLLSAYHTLTGWSEAVARTGAGVQVVQRFSADAHRTHHAIDYTFVAEGTHDTRDPWTRFDRLCTVVADAGPDVVHLNGLMFPGVIEALRGKMPPATVIVLQDHSGSVPRRMPWPVHHWSVRRWRHAFAMADACTFTARELAERWLLLGLPRELSLLEIPEASTHLTPLPTEEAISITGIDASPAILWVGRLDANKDPLTILGALERTLPRLPSATCWMIYGAGDLEPAVRRQIARSAVLRDRVLLVGAVAHPRMAAYYSAADVFLSGSHHEGSGYALLESLACGVTPCVTDIPAFRALTGSSGARFAVGDASACARAILDLAARDRAIERVSVRRHFDEHLSWDVIGQRTVQAYADLARRRTDGRRR